MTEPLDNCTSGLPLGDLTCCLLKEFYCGDLYVMRVNSSPPHEIEVYINNRNSRPVTQTWQTLPHVVRERFHTQLLRRGL